MKNPPVTVSVYSDYICPFCYIGYLRLEKLKQDYDLEVDWRFMEIHPDNPEQGRPLSELGYPPQHWAMLMENLKRMAKEEGVELAERTFTTNSRRALKLAHAVASEQPELFEALNKELYEAYFLRRVNIGDPETLRQLAKDIGVSESLIDRAWTDPAYEQVLMDNLHSAGMKNIHGTPTYVFGSDIYSGAIPVSTLRQAVERSLDL